MTINAHCWYLIAALAAILVPTLALAVMQYVSVRRLRAHKDGLPLDLSPREFEILQLLIVHKGETVTREELPHHIWGSHASLYTRTIDAHIARLRQKLEPEPTNPQHIITIHRVGYRLIADSQPQLPVL